MYVKRVQKIVSINEYSIYTLLTMAYLMYIPEQLTVKSTYVISTLREMQDKDIFVNVMETMIRGQTKRKE